MCPVSGENNKAFVHWKKTKQNRLMDGVYTFQFWTITLNANVLIYSKTEAEKRLCCLEVNFGETESSNSLLISYSAASGAWLQPKESPKVCSRLTPFHQSLQCWPNITKGQTQWYTVLVWGRVRENEKIPLPFHTSFHAQLPVKLYINSHAKKLSKAPRMTRTSVSLLGSALVWG